MSLSTIAAIGATKIYSWYLQSTPTHLIVASFHVLRDQTRKIITPMTADCMPTRTITTASPTRLAETRRYDHSDNVLTAQWRFVESVR